MPVLNDKTKIVAIKDKARVMTALDENGKSSVFRTVPKDSHFVVYNIEADGYFHIGGQKFAHKDDFRIDEQGEDFLGIEHNEV